MSPYKIRLLPNFRNHLLKMFTIAFMKDEKIFLGKKPPDQGLRPPFRLNLAIIQIFTNSAVFIHKACGFLLLRFDLKWSKR